MDSGPGEYAYPSESLLSGVPTLSLISPTAFPSSITSINVKFVKFEIWLKAAFVAIFATSLSSDNSASNALFI